MPRVFICYRRDDASEAAERLYNNLTRCFGSRYVFWDRDSTYVGIDFVRRIQHEVDICTTFLVVIGKEWLAVDAEGQRRIDDPDDLVRMEITRALERAGKLERINIIPVLVDGAKLPLNQDLPDDLKELVHHNSIGLSSENWKKDIRPLLRVIEKGFTGSLLYSLIGGAIAGLIAGLIVGWLYWRKYHPAVEVGRIFIGGLYGLFAGAVLGYFINAGITWRSRIFRKTKYSKMIDGTAGGAFGGIIAGVAGGFLFAPLLGGTIDPYHLAFAVTGSSILVILAILFPELKGTWHKPVLSIIIIACVTLVTTSLAVWVLPKLFVDFGNPPFSQGVLILSLICGTMSGFQVGSVLFIYDHFKDKLENKP
jgi:hypothetical protein